MSSREFGLRSFGAAYTWPALLNAYVEAGFWIAVGKLLDAWDKGRGR